MTAMQLPDEFVRNLEHVLGDRARAWLDGLPALIEACERDYGLTIGPRFELSYNYVAPATLVDGTEAVLKLSPHGDEFRHELTATRHYGGHGMARLLEADPDRGIALLERLRPGAMLVDLDATDDAKTEIAADVIKKLLREPPPDHGLPSARDWFVAFAKHREAYGGHGPLPKALFERGEATYEDLLNSAGPDALLHGDLHHYNVLSADRAPWLAIDPHGLVGDPVFEIGAFFGNPLDIADRPGLSDILDRRAHIFAERLGFDRHRVVDWAFAYQMLSAAWSAENNGTKWTRAMHVAEALATLT
jgi:streptomycin 6-kinase